MITSPGLRRVKVLMYSISSATLWIMLLVLSSCTMRPFSQVRIARLCGSRISSAVAIHGPNAPVCRQFFPAVNQVCCQSRAEPSM